MTARYEQLLGDAQQYAERWGRSSKHTTWAYFRELVKAVDVLLRENRELRAQLNGSTPDPSPRDEGAASK